MQSLDSEKGLIKFSHCKKDIFCSYVPKLCPVCGQSLNYRRLEDAPVSIPSPFVNGHRQKCSFLLKPTTGTFLREYDGSSDLHVGISNTNGSNVLAPCCHIRVANMAEEQLFILKENLFHLEFKKKLCPLGFAKGLVYNYNETGIHRVELGWEQCISIPLVQPDMYGLLKQWDKYLEEFSTGEAWFFHRYDEHYHNCYIYALAFINCVLAAQGKQPMSKSEFTERFVIPQTRKASKYITVYREVAENYFYIGDSPDQEQNNSEEDKLLH